MRDASIIVDTYAVVESDEDVLLIIDWQVANVTEQVVAAAQDRDTDVSLISMESREYDRNEPEVT